LGVVLGNEKVAHSLKSGEHGTTFGGGPLACRIALEVLDVIEEEGLIAKAAEQGAYLMERLSAIMSRHACIHQVRGLGLMIGVEVGSVAPEVVRRLLQKGVIANAAHGMVLRLVPPLIVTREQIDQFMEALDQTLSEMESA
jgi:acetylornithine/succinyldiaminopimelate/putrescine aminotransferase